MRKQLSEQRDFMTEMKLANIPYRDGYYGGWMPLALKLGYITDTYGD